VYASLTLCVVNNRPCYLPGIEARGFIFGPAIALAIGAKFIPLRKPKKLPGNVFEQVTKYGPKQTNKDIVMGGVKSYCTSELDILTHMITLKEPTSYILHIHSTLENFILPPFIFICHFRLTFIKLTIILTCRNTLLYFQYISLSLSAHELFPLLLISRDLKCQLKINRRSTKVNHISVKQVW
jgi:hypothetical protein